MVDQVMGRPAGHRTTTRLRWTPSQQQLQILERLFEEGSGTPNKQRIKEITAELIQHGQIAETNVYNWFQNRKARAKRKQQQVGRTRRARLSRGESARKLIINVEAGSEVDLDVDSSPRLESKRPRLIADQGEPTQLHDASTNLHSAVDTTFQGIGSSSDPGAGDGVAGASLASLEERPHKVTMHEFQQFEVQQEAHAAAAISGPAEAVEMLQQPNGDAMIKQAEIFDNHIYVTSTSLLQFDQHCSFDAQGAVDAASSENIERMAAKAWEVDPTGSVATSFGESSGHFVDPQTAHQMLPSNEETMCLRALQAGERFSLAGGPVPSMDASRKGAERGRPKNKEVVARPETCVQ